MSYINRDFYQNEFGTESVDQRIKWLNEATFLSEVTDGAPADLTKWGTRMKAINEALEELRTAVSELEGLADQPCQLTCGGCNAAFADEADFARHFVISKTNRMSGYLNLGECPDEAKGKAIVEASAR